MNKSLLGVVFVSCLILVGGVFLLSRNQSLPPVANLEYFWGNGCPHCRNVADFMQDWDKKDSVQMEKYEVYGSSANAQRFAERIKVCNFTAGEIGVPVLITPDNQCFFGDTPIIDYLKSL